MKLDLVLITTGSRPRLLEQSLRSLRENAAHWADHSLTLVIDGCSVVDVCRQAEVVPDRIIINPERQGASRSRNIGASSTPGYLRKDAVCFFDDDVYLCKGWDEYLAAVLGDSSCAASLHSHPFNHTILGTCLGGVFTTVLSSVNIACAWSMWDDVGCFQEPGGPGGSEDVDWCKRASEKGYGLAVSRPHYAIHTGIGSTSGKKLIGWEQVMDNNVKLEAIHGLVGKVWYE